MTKRVTEIDGHIGKRIKTRRHQMSMSQEDVAKLLGVTFQQIQKYENGKNGARGSRLYQLAQALSCPVSFFFDGLEEQPAAAAGDYSADFMSDRLGSEIAQAFLAMPQEKRFALRTVAETLAAT